MQASAIPRGAIAILAVFYAITLAAWLFLTHGFDDLHWFTISLSAAVAAMFVSFGVSLLATLKLLGSKYPAWLGRTQAANLAASGMLLQSLFAGVLALVGAWPHRAPWFLGVIAFLWRG